MTSVSDSSTPENVPMTRRWPSIVVALLIGTIIAPLAGSAQQAGSSALGL
jgi:hypothetical protein